MLSGLASGESGISTGARVYGSLALVGGLAVVSVAGMLVSGGNPVVTAAPPLLVALLLVVARLPLRLAIGILVCLLLAAEVRTDAAGIWSSPFVIVGDILGYGLVDLTRMPFAGFEIITVALLGIAAMKRMTKGAAPPDQAKHTAVVMRDCVLLYLAGYFFSVAASLAHRHGVPLWKSRYLLHVPFFFLLFQVGLRGPSDFGVLAKGVVVAAHVKAVLAVVVQTWIAPALTGGRLACATNHGDSVLFALAVLIVALPLLEQPTKRAVLRAVLLLPLPLWGMVLNGRRLVWAILAMSFAAIFLATSWRPWKRRLVRSALVAAPIIGTYVIVGWNSPGTAGGIFLPIAEIRTMLDSSVDHSTLWREREDWNIAMSIRAASPLGVGLGGEYVEYMFNDDISAIYADYRAWPHNTILGLLLLAGVPGFIGLWSPFLITVFLALRAERRARSTQDRIMAYLCISAVVACLAMAWGDTGLHHLQVKLAAAIAMALSGKLAVATGAWPAARTKHDERQGSSLAQPPGSAAAWSPT